MESTYNDRDHRRRRAKAELARVERDLKKLRAEVSALDELRAELVAELEAWARRDLNLRWRHGGSVSGRSRARQEGPCRRP